MIGVEVTQLRSPPSLADVRRAQTSASSDFGELSRVVESSSRRAAAGRMPAFPGQLRNF